jgi:hypothetical protein
MKDLKMVTVNELHNSIRTFIVDSSAIIGDYEDMKSLILTMIKAGYMFNMNRDRLKDAMEDLTFMLCPDDDANRDRVERGLEYEDDDSDDDSDDMESEMMARATRAGQERLAKQTDRDDNTIEDIGSTSDLN